MADFEDYYEILQVHFLAEPEIIKAAFRRLALMYAPDVNKSPDANARMVKINAAYAILNDPDERKKYDPEWIKRKQGPQRPGTDKPKPTIEPNHIQFTDVKPNEVKQASFLIFNAGGSYKKIWFSDPKSWVRITNYFSLTGSDELPLKVEIEAQGYDWDKDYLEYIKVRLDDEETQVRIGLKTGRKPAPPSPPPPPPPPSFSYRKRNANKSNWWKPVVGVGLIILVIIVATQMMQSFSGIEPLKPPTTSGQPPTTPGQPPTTPEPPTPQNLTFREIDISSIANSPSGINSLSNGKHSFNRVDFYISRIFMTQYGAGSQPEEGILNVDIAHPVTVYILINSDCTYQKFRGKQAGKITLIFNSGPPEETNLFVGQNIREYTMNSNNTVQTVADTNSKIAWQGANPPTIVAIDMLTIPIINQSRTLKQIIITDTSQTTTNSTDPGLIVWGLTIAYYEK